MSTDIKCPNCGHQFPIEEAVSEEYKKELREQMLVYKKQKDEELAGRLEELTGKEKELAEKAQKQETVFTKRMAEEKIRLQQFLEESIRRNIAGDFENRLQLLQQANREN